MNAYGTRKPSRLINLNTRFEAQNDVVEQLECQYKILQDKLNGKLKDSEINEALTEASKDPKFNEIISGGLLYGFLIDPQNSQKLFVNLSPHFNNDAWYLTLMKMNMVLLEIFYKLQSSARQQLLILFDESIKNNIPKIDNVLTNFFRTISDGCEYKETCSMVLGITEILNTNYAREWIRALKVNSTFAPIALMTFSRFISDYQQFGGSNNETFKNSLISTIEFLLRERFFDMLFLGRDLVLILMRLSKIPQFGLFWKALIYKPETLLTKFGGVQQLISMPCTNIACSYRVSLHISRKVEYILKMKPTAQTRYLEWLAKAHLSGIDSGSLRAEIIRFVWCGIQLSENQQQSAIESRAHFLCWLLNNARQGTELQWCKLYLFWDWFGFDNNNPFAISYVEPAFSVIRYLISSIPTLANSLIDFLARQAINLHPPLSAFFISNITAAFKALGNAGMPISLLDHSKFEKIAKDLFRETFPEVLPKPELVSIVANRLPSVLANKAISSSSSSSSSNNEAATSTTTTPDFLDIILDRPSVFADEILVPSSQQQQQQKIAANINDDLERILISKTTKMKKKKLHSLKSKNSIEKFENKIPTFENSSSIYMEVDNDEKEIKIIKTTMEKETTTTTTTAIEEDVLYSSNTQRNLLKKPISLYTPMLKVEFRENVERLNEFKDNEISEDYGDAMQNLLMAIFEDEDELDNEQSELIAECLLRIFHKCLFKSKFILFDDTNMEDFEEFAIPFFAIFRHLCMTQEGDASRRPLLMIITDMREKCENIGFIFLYFIKISFQTGTTNNDSAIDAYTEFCKYMEKSIEQQLVEDLEQCAFNDHELFAYLLPFVFDKLSNVTIGSASLMHLICSTIDNKQLAELIGEIIRENITLFRKDSFQNLMLNSLGWESVEQIFLWQLIRAEGIPFEWIQGIINRIIYSKHSEAISNILLMMKTVNFEPNMMFLRNLLNRPYTDLFVVHALKVLIEDDETLNRIANLFNTLIKKLMNSSDIMDVKNGGGGGQQKSSSTKTISAKKSTITIQTVFSHLDQFRRNCLTKESKRAENLLSTCSFKEIFMLTNRYNDLKAMFSELFAVMEIFCENKESLTTNARTPRKNRSKINDYDETKLKRQKNAKRNNSNLDSDDSD